MIFRVAAALIQRQYNCKYCRCFQFVSLNARKWKANVVKALQNQENPCEPYAYGGWVAEQADARGSRMPCRNPALISRWVIARPSIKGQHNLVLVGKCRITKVLNRHFWYFYQ